ncbi:MAG: hypothetical protein AAGJ35_00800 [Myxococcota bacterium]
MSHPFQELDPQHAALLCFALLKSGAQTPSLLNHLEHSEPLQEQAQALCQPSLRPHLPSIAHELKKRLVQHQSHPLQNFAPAWIAEFVQGESPRIMTAWLQGLHPNTRKHVKAHLAPSLAHNLDRNRHNIHPQVKPLLYQQLRQRLPVYPQKFPQQLNLEALLALEKEDISNIIEELGYVEMAIAFHKRERGYLLELCRKFPKNFAERLIQNTQKIPESSSSRTKAALRLIRTFSAQTHQTLFYTLGQHAFCLAVHQEQPQILRALAFRLPYEQGIQLYKFTHEPIPQKILLHRQHDLMRTIQDLATQDRISTAWQELPLDLPELPPPTVTEQPDPAPQDPETDENPENEASSIPETSTNADEA